VPRPAGADAVVPLPARFGGLRLAVLRLRARGRLRIEGSVSLGRGVAVRVAAGADVVLGDGVHLGDGCRLEALDGRLRLGARTLVGPRAFVVSLAGMEVGEDCVIGDFAGVGVPGAPGRSGPVAIGARSRIAAHGTVESGATVPAGSVLGSYLPANATPDV
jgi:carbonic anhydrase/acetyltransferase-like protein (isoleucine patch superfamily)